MSLSNTFYTYGSVTKFFHWLLAILIIGMLIYGFLLEDVPKPYQGMSYNIHKLIGLTIFTLMALRALWAAMNVKPVLPPNTPWWQQFAERFVHYILYVVVLMMPVVGLVGSCALGRPPHLGPYLISLPIAKDKALGDLCFSIHNFLAYTLIGLLCVHVIAALYHHFIKRDNILRRMLPNRT